ncbi:hypothetical protein [Brevibacillus composti]|uniref:hypothetical protein n=1 Tax=Brevibacillus composti TaxID=2796470 RepID=UPI001E503152|nr:hypothetical protein [Brevibacillus composti]
MTRSGGVHCGVRHIRKDEDGEWRTDVVGHKRAEDFKVAIVSSRSHFNITTYSQIPLTPYIVSLLIRETGPMYDDGIRIEAEPKEVTEENAAELASLINCQKYNFMPVIYVSKQFFGGTYLTDPRRLAQKLAGLAHVYFETDTKVSTILRALTDGKNAYNGSIGIYWQNHNYKRFLLNDTDENISLKIQNYVKTILNTRKTADECRWSYVQHLKYQRAIDRYREGEAENTVLIDYALQENQELQEQVKSLEAENYYLRERQQMFFSNELDEQRPLIFKGAEAELFASEQAELILEIIEEKLRSGSCSVRIRNMLESILEANERTNNKETFLAQVKTVLTEPGGLSSQGKRELVKLGFELTEEGKHYKLKIKGDDRYPHPIAKTPSDVRSSENNFSQFKKRFF